MCSVTIDAACGRLMVTMNRDERRDRGPEIPPFSWPGDLVAPRDERSGGTGVGTNRYGDWACILNSYEDIPHRKSPRSRGLIIPALLTHVEPEAALQRLDPKDFCKRRFPPTLN